MLDHADEGLGEARTFGQHPIARTRVEFSQRSDDCRLINWLGIAFIDDSI